MANYKCEERSILCTKFQSAICLHCNRRLCLEHITEHNKIIYNNVDNLSKEIKKTFQEIKDESNTRKDTFNNILTSFNQWKTKQIDKIQQIYDNNVQSIEFQRNNLIKAEFLLYEQLEQNASQPIQHIKQQQNASADMINDIEQTIKKVREDNIALKWQLEISSPPMDVEFTPLKIPSILSIPNETHCESVKKRKLSSTIDNERPSNGQALRRLVTMFSDLSYIQESKRKIFNYVKISRSNLKLPNFICSYITAWHRQTVLDDKKYLLNEHILTVQKVLKDRNYRLDVIFGIQAFFYNENIEENKIEMMRFLLEFFLNHNCTDTNSLYKWYNDIKVSRYEGLNQAKQLAKPFIESLSTISPVENTRTIPSNFGQSFLIDIKEEPTFN